MVGKSDNLQLAKATPIPAILNHYGLSGQQHGNNLFYYSPWRAEKVRSFCVRIKQNTWIDYGSREWGDGIDLMAKLENCTTGEAINLIVHGKKNYRSIKLEPPVDTKIEILTIEKVAKPELKDYLCSRKIDLDIADKYVMEAKIQFTKSSKVERVLAFKNNKNGYEFRTSWLKVSNSPKWYTTIKGENKDYRIFEGFFDFLSALTYFKRDSFEENVIVLNSLSFLTGLLDTKLFVDCVVELFLDNDRAGDEAVDMCVDAGLAVQDKRVVFAGYKDFNDLLLGKQKDKVISKEEFYYFQKNIN